MSPDLRPALKALYAAFRQRGPAPTLRGCPCCTTPAEFEALASKPLQHLSAQELDRYARKAMTTVGHTEAFRYFLPRIVELAAGSSEWAPASPDRATNATGQFDIADDRSPAQIRALLQRLGYEPVWKDWEAVNSQ